MNFLDLLKALNSIDGFLHYRVIVLNAKAISSRAQVVKGLELFFTRVVRVSFIAEFEVRKTVCFFEDAIDEFFQVLCREKSRGSSTEVYLFYFWALFKEIAIQVPFLENGIQIRLLDAVSFGDPLVTGAKSAKVFTEGQVYVKTDSFFFIAFAEGSSHGFLPVGKSDAFFVPKGNCRVTGVPGSRDIVFLDKRRFHGWENVIWFRPCTP